MKKGSKHLCAILMLGVLSLSICGCSGRIAGSDTLEPVAGYSNSGIYSATQASVTSSTAVTRICKEFFTDIQSSDYDAAMKLLNISDTTFVSSTGLSQWVLKNLTSVNVSSIEEYTRSGTKYATCTLDDNSSITLICTPNTGEESPDWLITIPDFVVTDTSISVPSGIEITYDTLSLNEYKETVGDNDIYTLPYTTYGLHDITLKTIFDTLEMQVDVQGIAIDMAEYMYVAEPRRAQIRELASKTLERLTVPVISNDWDKFIKYFASGVITADFSAAFHKGNNVKSQVYDLKLLETRDLEKSLLDVRYVSYDTIEVYFGTRWQWAASGDFTYKEKDDIYTVRKYSEMRIENTLRLRYDGKSWYVVWIDDDSLARLTVGLEQWK